MTQPKTALPLTAPLFDSHETLLVEETLKSGWVTQGPHVKRFEELVAERHGVGHALAVTSCTAALHLATLALGIGPGDEVIVPAFTWVTSAHCAEYVGARAVFCDIDLATFNIDPESLENAITARTRAVVVVHLFGLAAPMDEIRRICSARGIGLIEDCACAIGTRYDGVPVGGLGDVGCFSFHPRKIITTGEGGMVTTSDSEIAEKVSVARNHGGSPDPGLGNASPRPYHMPRFDTLGFNLRMSDIQAAVGIAQLAKLDGLLAERLACARLYDQLLAEVNEFVLPSIPEKCNHTYQSYVVRLRNGDREARNRVMDYLVEKGIQTRPGTHAVHRLGYYQSKYGLRPEEFQNACVGEDTTITLPIFPGMTEEDQTRVAVSIKDGLARA